MALQQQSDIKLVAIASELGYTDPANFWKRYTNAVPVINNSQRRNPAPQGYLRAEIAADVSP